MEEGTGRELNRSKGDYTVKIKDKREKVKGTVRLSSMAGTHGDIIDIS